MYKVYVTELNVLTGEKNATDSNRDLNHWVKP